MRDTIEQRVEKIQCGYVVQTMPRKCATCGCVHQPLKAGGKRGPGCGVYRCRRHKFNVNSNGVCVDWQREKWANPRSAPPDNPLFDGAMEQVFQ